MKSESVGPESYELDIKKGEGFYEQGDPFVESAKFDRVLQESKFKLKRIRYEAAQRVDYKIHRHHSNSSGLPQNFDSNLAIAELSTFSDVTQEQTVEYIEPKEEQQPRKSKLGPRKSKKSLKVALENEPVQQIKRLRDGEKEYREEGEEVELGFEEIQEDKPYVEIRAERVYRAPQEEEVQRPDYTVRRSLRPRMTINERRRSAITRDDFQININTLEDEEVADYNLEFVSMTPPSGEQSKDWKQKAGMRKSLRVSPFSYLTRDETPQKAYLESFKQHVTPQLFESDISYQLHFEAE